MKKILFLFVFLGVVSHALAEAPEKIAQIGKSPATLPLPAVVQLLPHIPQLPDIQDGFIYNDFKGDGDADRNVFITEIQGILYDQDTMYVLSHECRGENINVADGRNLFKRKSYEFVSLLKITDQKITAKAFRRSHLFNLNPFKYSPPMEFQSTYDAEESSYEASLREVEYLDFDQLQEGLMKKEINIRNLFIKYTLNYDGHLYTLLTPVRYVNFPNSKRGANNYLQPMSGIVPIPYKDEIRLGYIVSLFRDGSVMKIESALSEEINLLDMLNYSPFFAPKDKSLKQKIKPFIKWCYSVMFWPLKNVYHFFSYSKIVELKGDAVFYRYKHPNMMGK